MAVLKRFSYDNIVEHNPTAPDPVEGGGGSGGGSYIVHVSGDSTSGYTADKSLADIKAAFESGVMPVVIYKAPESRPFLGSTVVIPLTRYYTNETGGFTFTSPVEVISTGDSAYTMWNVTFLMFVQGGQDYIVGGPATYSVRKES